MTINILNLNPMSSVHLVAEFDQFDFLNNEKHKELSPFLTINIGDIRLISLDPVTVVKTSRNFKRGIRSLFDPCANAMGGGGHIDRHVWRWVIVPSDLAWTFCLICAYYCYRVIHRAITYMHAWFMQLPMGILNAPSSRIVNDLTPSWRRILRYINFGIGESWPISIQDMVNLDLIIFEARWILNERAFYYFIIFFVWKRILT